MKKSSSHIIAAVGALIVGVALAGCVGSSAEANVEYLPVQIDKDGDWSLLAPDGTIRYKEEFKSEPSCVVNGYFTVKEADGYTLYKVGEKPVPVKDCENLKDVGEMVDGLIPVVRTQSRITVVDGNGAEKFVLQPYKGTEIDKCSSRFSDGLLWVKLEDEKNGFVDTSGKMVIAPKYDSAQDFHEGLAIVKEKDRYSIINTKGETLTQLKKGWKPQSRFYGSTLIVEDETGRFHRLDKKNLSDSEKLPAKVKAVGEYNDKYCDFSDGNHWGVMAFDSDEVVVRPIYESVQFLPNGTFLCQGEKRYDIRDAKGDVIQRIDEDTWMVSLPGFGILSVGDSSVELFDVEGNPKKGCDFANIPLYVYLTAAQHITTLSSDYLDCASMAASLTAPVTAEGYGQLKFGMAPSSISFLDKDECSYEYQADVDSLTTAEGKFRRTGNIGFDTYMAHSEEYPDYEAWVMRRRTVWNPAKLNRIDLYVTASGDLGTPAVKAVTAALEKKGFTITASKYSGNNAIVALRNGNAMVVVGSPISSRKELEMLLVSAPSDSDRDHWNKLVDDWKWEAVNDSDEEAVAVDSVAW